MNIFGIIGITLILALAIALLASLLCLAIYEHTCCSGGLLIAICIIIGVIAWIGGVFIGIGINTRSEEVYIQKYLAQKETIEISLESDNLTGFERAQLVSKAAELNGEFAEKRAKFDLWYYVYYSNDIYDNIDFINIGG